jgi:hypothetical protein
MANVPTYQLSRSELIKSLRWLSACATDERDMMILSYCERLLVSGEVYWRPMLILAALENGAQTRDDLRTVTGFSDRTIRRYLTRLLLQQRVEVRFGESGEKLYFICAWAEGGQSDQFSPQIHAK